MEGSKKIPINHQSFESGVYIYQDCPDEICFLHDGDMIGAVRSDFVNLQESPAGFGKTEVEAYEDLLEMENK